MARPRSDDKRRTILSAAARAIATQGSGVATAVIAKEAGVSNGSLFTYFASKSDLLNGLYVELKQEMAAAALDGLPAEGDLREQLCHLWTRWLHWATTGPEKRRTLAQLDVSDDITPDSRETARQSMAGIGALLQRSRAHGALRDAPLDFALALMNALADTTTDAMLRDPAHADQHRRTGFEALWRMVT